MGEGGRGRKGKQKGKNSTERRVMTVILPSFFPSLLLPPECAERGGGGRRGRERGGGGRVAILKVYHVRRVKYELFCCI